MIDTVVKTACFAGQNIDYTDEVRLQLTRTIRMLIENHGVSRFFAAKGGKFDVLCSEVITSLKAKYPQIRLCIVIPTSHPRISDKYMLYYCDYDCIHSLDLSERMPCRNFAAKVNQYMIDNSQYLVCYVSGGSGIASRALKYAVKKGGIEAINLCKRDAVTDEQTETDEI